ncbi:polysaccharide export protein [Rheinheimera sp. MMS21-TC3]|uniref:polysaccharide export protein n=1 Tax=Rheinheimera sp. MMS21-TC3 TaxID=3072790 RepID=UPI0028C37E06|nr:polysaccharide export protein [Rheinheimera sp. MMS21-TC3]WNO61707.1 polysaccharide export protein [Rheinheimera sp. MMS21-TC3]
MTLFSKLFFGQTPLKAIVSSCAVLMLSGCMLAPGSFVKSDEAAPGLDNKIKFYNITPQVIAENKLMRQPATDLVANTSFEQEQKDYDYRVGRGDVLNITVWEHPELTIPAGSMRSPEDAGTWVHNDGRIFYPYIGWLEVEGLKVTEIRYLLAHHLGKYIEKPQVDVTVASFRSQRIYVTGEVQKPGVLPVTNVPTSLIEAINASGGLTEAANWEQVSLLRDGKEQKFSLRKLYQQGNTEQNIMLKRNDVLHVARNDDNKVFVLGEVRQPKSYLMGRNGMSLAEALAEAGGLYEQTADASGVFVIRQAAADSGRLADVFQLNAKNATALIMAEQFQLQQRDVIYVTAAPVARWNRVISQLLPSITGLYSIGRFQSDLK